MAGELDGRRVAMRMEPAAVAFVRDFVQSGKPVASICHGSWNFVVADVARGRRLTPLFKNKEDGCVRAVFRPGG